MEKVNKCYLCKNRLDKDAIGLNKKLLAQDPSKFMCVECLAAHLDVSTEDLYEKIIEFKEQGCTLFQ